MNTETFDGIFLIVFTVLMVATFVITWLGYKMIKSKE